jgi:hypothetical protein
MGGMKAWEETWRQSEAYPGDVFGDGGGDILFEGTTSDNEAHARAKLAAQAPAMARLLLKLQKVVFAVGWENVGGCAACHDGSGWTGDPVEHTPDCELAAVLRAAGVVE